MLVNTLISLNIPTLLLIRIHISLSPWIIGIYIYISIHPQSQAVIHSSQASEVIPHRASSHFSLCAMILDRYTRYSHQHAPLGTSNLDPLRPKTNAAAQWRFERFSLD